MILMEMAQQYFGDLTRINTRFFQIGMDLKLSVLPETKPRIDNKHIVGCDDRKRLNLHQHTADRSLLKVILPGIERDE